jgi:hypothetical protein
MKMRKRVMLAVTNAIVLISVSLAAQTGATAPAAVPMPAECAAWLPKSSEITTLKQVKRVFVDSFGTDPVANQIQAMVIAQLLQSDRFVVTENRGKADAILKGAGVEKTSVESHSYESGTAAGSASGGYSGSIYGSSGGFSAAGAAINDAYSSSATVNDARVSVRLVNQDGDVIWATSQESKGAKYKGASADVADKVVKQLIRDVEKKSLPTSAAAN